jgi:putative MATE family efflux protein
MKELSLTEGKIAKNLILFMIPILAGSLIQQLYNTVDLILVGKYTGTQATAAIGSSSLIVTCLIGFFTGMSVGTNVVTAHVFGSKDEEKLKRLVQTVFVLGVIGGLVLMIIGITLAPVFLFLMNTPDEIFIHAEIYLRIYMLSMVGIVLYNLASGISRAIGDSRSPMMIQLIGGFINVVADVFLVAGLNMGVTGAAIATFLSQTTAGFLMVYQINSRLVKKNFFTSFKAFDINFLRRIMKIGVPAGVQSMIITFSNIVIQSQINKFGVDVITAFTAYFKIELLIYLPIMAIGQAVVSFVGQNYGAGQFERMKKGVRTALFIGIGMTVVISAVLMIFREPAFSIFTSDEAAITYGSQVAGITFPLYFLYVLLECFSGEIRGIGEAFGPMIITVFSFCVVRVSVLMVLLRLWNDVKAVALVYPISWASAAGLLFIYRMLYRRKKLKKGD